MSKQPGAHTHIRGFGRGGKILLVCKDENRDTLQLFLGQQLVKLLQASDRYREEINLASLLKAWSIRAVNNVHLSVGDIRHTKACYQDVRIFEVMLPERTNVSLACK